MWGLVFLLIIMVLVFLFVTIFLLFLHDCCNMTMPRSFRVILDENYWMKRTKKKRERNIILKDCQGEDSLTFQEKIKIE